MANFYESFLHDYFIKNVIDMTPGGGRRHLHLHRVRRHASAIRAYLMRKIVESMCNECSKLYQPKFAKLLEPKRDDEPKPKGKTKPKPKQNESAHDAPDDKPQSKKRRTSKPEDAAEELSDFAFSELDDEEEEVEEEVGKETIECNARHIWHD